MSITVVLALLAETVDLWKMFSVVYNRSPFKGAPWSGCCSPRASMIAFLMSVPTSMSRTAPYESVTGGILWSAAVHVLVEEEAPVIYHIPYQEH